MLATYKNIMQYAQYTISRHTKIYRKYGSTISNASTFKRMLDNIDAVETQRLGITTSSSSSRHSER